MPSWSNWAGNQTANPRSILLPASVAELQELMCHASSRGVNIRPVGAGHSFAPLCSSDGLLLDLRELSGIDSIDVDDLTVSAYAGTRIAALGPALADHGLALANQGDIDAQAVAGAVATGTHGTGSQFGSMSQLLRGIEMVAADGSLIEFNERDGEEFHAAALSLGVLGVATRLSLRVVQAFRLRREARLVAWQDCLRDWIAIEESARNAEFYWLPGQDVCVTKTFNETDEPPSELSPQPLAPPGTVERYLVPDRVAWSWQAFPSVRTAPFVEMEYSVPLSGGLDALQELRCLMQRHHSGVTWAVEYRTQGGDDCLLSPTQGRRVATISVHESPGHRDPKFMRDAETLFCEHGGRPHWGKLQSLTSAELQGLYPALPAFNRIRRRLDPSGVFLNDYLRSFLS
jgi:FAD/FMN-containing dehydrogenase